MANLRVDKITSTETFETTGSVQFDGTGDYLSLSGSNQFDFGTGDFTIEAFLFPPTTQVQYANIVCQATTGDAWYFSFSTSNSLTFSNYSTNYIISSSTLSTGVWSHVAVSRKGTSLKMYINGIEVGSTTNSVSLGVTANVNIGFNGVSHYFNGHISNLRILKGKALYTENFTPPTRELTVTPETVLLACQHKTDASQEKTGKTITVNGNAVANELTPGLLTDVVKSGGSSAITGSVEFDGTGDYLQITEENDFDLGADNFTIEYWYNEGNDDRTERRTLYLRDSGTGSFVVGHTNDNSGRIFFQPRDSSGNTLGGSALVTGDASNPTGKRNYWRHYAVCRDGTTARCFLDGVLQNSLSYGTTAIRGDHNNLYIGHDPATAGRNFRGFISNLRIVKGTALYTDNFIPPTRELKKVPGTVLLCCQDSNDPTTEATGKTITGFGDLDQVYNTELVTNGDFSDGTNNWTQGVNGVISVSSGQLTITNSGGTNGRATSIAFKTTIGARYVLKYDAITTGGSYRAEIRNSTGGGSEQAFQSTTDGATETFEFQATESQHTVVLYSIGADTIATTYDNVSVYKVNPGKTGSDFTPQVGNDDSVEFVGPTKINTENYFYLPTGDTESRNLTNSRGDRGIFSGGHSPTNRIDFITISSSGNAQDFGDLTYTPFYGAACASSTRGLHAGGATPTIVNTINYLTIMTMGNAFDFGDLTGVKRDFNALASRTRGVFVGGITPTEIDTIDFVTIATTSNAIDFGNLSSTRQQVSGSSSPTRGIISGGYVSPAAVNTIEYITIASTGDAVDFGDLATSTWALTALASQTRSIIGGGAINPGGGTTATNTASYITIASTGNANDFGDLTVGRFQLAGASNSTRGAFAGGYIPSPTSANQDTIDYVTIASTGNAQDFGNLTGTRRELGGCSNGHGGLG